ncbi:MAG: hypothetical protein AMXMBFR44_3930 [Candidatus Campbellbacteria bacterium]
MDPRVAIEEWRATQESGTPSVVSSFYEGLARKMTGGVTAGAEEGDVTVWIGGTAIGVEVKGGSPNNAFRMREKQLEKHKLRAKMFPYDGHFFYFFFNYVTYEPQRTAKDGRRRCMLRRAVERGHGPEFLIDQTRHLWIVPVQLIEGILLFSPTLRTNLVGGDTGVRIKRQVLKDFAKRLRGAPHNKWGVRDGHADLLPPRRRTRRITFGVTMFLYPGMPELPLHGTTWK